MKNKTFNNCAPLSEYITSRLFFDFLSRNGQEKSKSLLLKLPALWLDDLFQMSESIKLMIVNDTAERGISLIHSYSRALTKDETQKQYLLQLVSLHRKQFHAVTKDALMKANK